MLAKKSRKYGFVPASYVVVTSSSPAGTSTGTRKSITRLEQAPRRLSKRNLLPIYDSNSKEKLVSSAAEEVEANIPPPQELNPLGWECESETEKVDSLDGEPDSEFADLEKINNRFSWCSNESQQFITTMGDQSQSITPPASLRNGERDSVPSYRLVDDGVRDGLPVLHSSGMLRQMRRPSQKETLFFDESSSDSGSTTSSRSVAQQDSVQNDWSFIEDADTSPPLGVEVQFLLDRFSSICLKDDPEKKISYPNPKSTWAKMMSILPLS